MSELHFFKEKRFKKEKLGFYIAVAICVVAIGGAAWSTYGSVLDYYDPSVISEETTTPYEDPASEANNPISGIVVGTTLPATEAPTETITEAATEAPTESPQDGTQSPTDSQETVNADVINLDYPVGSVAKEFSGDRVVYNKTFDDWRAHTGVDFKAPKNENVKSMADGKIINIYNDDLYGKTVVIDHNGGVTAYYSGLSDDIPVNINDTVSRGDVIGKVGTVLCEALDDSHIHVGIEVNGAWIDPMTLIKVDE